MILPDLARRSECYITRRSRHTKGFGCTVPTPETGPQDPGSRHSPASGSENAFIWILIPVPKASNNPYPTIPPHTTLSKTHQNVNHVRDYPLRMYRRRFSPPRRRLLFGKRKTGAGGKVIRGGLVRPVFRHHSRHAGISRRVTHSSGGSLMYRLENARMPPPFIQPGSRDGDGSEN